MDAVGFNKQKDCGKKWKKLKPFQHENAYKKTWQNRRDILYVRLHKKL